MKTLRPVSLRAPRLPGAGPIDTRWFPDDGLLDLADYAPLGRWKITRWEATAGGLRLSLKEWRTRLEAEVPSAVYEQATYPNVSEAARGKRRPIVYGTVRRCPAYLIDTVAGTWEVAGHELTSLGPYFKGDGSAVTPDSVDLANGRFTWTGWTEGERVVADAVGVPATAGGGAMTNPADVIGDLITTWGGEPAASLDTTAFAAARAEWVLGLDRRGRDVHRPAVSLYLGDPDKVLDVVGRLLYAARGLCWVSAEGLYTLRAWSPGPLEGATLLDDASLFDLGDERDVQDAASRAVARYQVPADGNDAGQLVALESTTRKASRNLPAHVAVDEELPLALREDARLWAGYEVASRGRPLRQLDATAAPSAALVEPGDVLDVRSTYYGVTEPLEVLEVQLDPTSAEVRLVLGDRRGFGDRVAFWTADSPALPARYGGAAVTAWDDGWTDDEAQWAKTNLGFWADDHGFADAADVRSFEGSVYT